MAIILPNSICIRVPRTGSTFVKDCLKDLKLNKGDIGLSHDCHKDLEGIASYDKVPFRFCFERNPLNWYKSYWAYKMTYKWSSKILCKADELDLYCRHGNFNEFIKIIASRYPKGFYRPMMEEYKATCTFVGRTENLREDLIEALTLAGEDFNADYIRKYPKRNQSDKKYSKSKIDQGTITLVRKIEGL